MFEDKQKSYQSCSLGGRPINNNTQPEHLM